MPNKKHLSLVFIGRIAFFATSIMPGRCNAVIGEVVGIVSEGRAIFVLVISVRNDHGLIRVKGVHIQEVPREVSYSSIQSDQLGALADPFATTVCSGARFPTPVPTANEALPASRQAIPSSKLR